MRTGRRRGFITLLKMTFMPSDKSSVEVSEKEVLRADRVVLTVRAWGGEGKRVVRGGWLVG